MSEIAAKQSGGKWKEQLSGAGEQCSQRRGPIFIPFSPDYKKQGMFLWSSKLDLHPFYYRRKHKAIAEQSLLECQQLVYGQKQYLYKGTEILFKFSM